MERPLWSIKIKGPSGINCVSVSIEPSDLPKHIQTSVTGTIKFHVPNSLRKALYRHGYSDRQIDIMRITEVRYPSDLAPEQKHAIDIILDY